MKRALEERLQQHLDGHQRQVKTLKEEISAKEAHISQVGVGDGKWSKTNPNTAYVASNYPPKSYEYF
jgi:hypothetical protein